METETLDWVPGCMTHKELHGGMEVDDVVWEYQQHVEMSSTELLNEQLYTDEAFKDLCNNQEALLRLDEVALEKVKRWANINALREHYILFEDFLSDCMEKLMGFECSDLQIDIGRFIADESLDRLMVQAQRSQAKSTIVAIYAVWKLIHNCRYRVLVVSAGSDVALEIANWIIQIIMTWDILACLRPDRQNGDRSSTKAFDINWMLKGAEKSPSVACIGITSNMQGRRADLLIPDDIESSKNGITETQRLALEHLSRDFTSICQKGRICFMGTPQTVDSIYKNLGNRGYTIRVWPGRYPSDEEIPRYQGRLAPYITERIAQWPACQKGGGLDGTRGWATDPVIQDERALQMKELDQGPEYFQLQYMLDTSLTDAGRYPLKPRNLIVMDIPLDQGPGGVTWMPRDNLKLPKIMTDHYHCDPELYSPLAVAEKMYDYEFKYIHIDPAGGGEHADEVVCVAGYLLHGNIFYPEVLALQGGHTDENLKEIACFIAKHDPNEVGSEQNMGHGAFAAMLRPLLAAEYKKLGRSESLPEIIDVWESKQKELRIIETLAPLFARHRIILDRSVIDYDYTSTRLYPLDRRDTYKLIHQVSRLTKERGALLHDDRLDTMQAVARHMIEWMGVDEQEAMEEKDTNENLVWLNTWGANVNDRKAPWAASHRFNRKRHDTHHEIDHSLRIGQHR